MAKPHKFDLSQDEVITLKVALEVYLQQFEGLDYHPNSQIGKVHELLKRIKAISHGDKSAGAYQNN